MGGKRRNTAKTGDKSLYSNRGGPSNTAATTRTKRSTNNIDDDDLIYDDVDQFHNNDYLRLDHDMDDDDSDDEDNYDHQEEGVMGIDSNDDNDDDDDDIDEEGDENIDDVNEDYDDEDEDEENEASLSSDEDVDGDDDGENENSNSVRNWGKNKNSYYYGDTADLEIGQEMEDAIIEEQAAKDVLQSRYNQMSEDDFIMDLGNIDDATTTTAINKDDTALSTKKHTIQFILQTLSKKEKRQLLMQNNHIEFISFINYFTSKFMHPYTTITKKAIHAIYNSSTDDMDDSNNILSHRNATADSIGATILGQQYLLTKALIQSSAALNLVMYLLLKTEQQASAAATTNVIANNSNSGHRVDPTLIQGHPVMQYLERLNSLNSKLEDGIELKVSGLTDQLQTIAKAADYLKESSEADDEDDDSDQEADNSGNIDSNFDKDMTSIDTENSDFVHIQNASELASAVVDEDDQSSVDEDLARRVTLNEARFGLRPSEIRNLPISKPINAQRRKNGVIATLNDAGDDFDLDDDETNRKKAGQSLNTTLNAIEQRSRTQQKRSLRSSEQLVEHIDRQPNDNDDDSDAGELRRGLEIMEAALGAPDEDEDEEKYDPELDEYDNGNEDDFYGKVSKKSKAAKEERKQRYAVAPKLPRVENDVIGDRTASKQILKNRGLVAHKAKLNRNPRVKKREAYRKANKRRAGAVQNIRSPSEGYNYGGEATGISTNVIRSRKLVS